ncbi:MAG: hypothetical protein AB1540_16380 [Bdellovibrionota bacterium]
MRRKPASKKKTTLRSLRAKKKSALKNRRKHSRHLMRKLWVTEKTGDFLFHLQALDISEGGIFLKKRLKTTTSTSELTLHLGKRWGSITVQARPIYDRLTKAHYGTAYVFVGFPKEQSPSLRSFFRNLNQNTAR